MYFDRNNITLQSIKDDLLTEKNISLTVARFDLLHPVVSGNKFYKLFYFLEEAKKNQSGSIYTYGGSYSNHLAATAFAAKASGIVCTGFIRGEKPATLSPTLQECISNGMQLEYLSRETYATDCMNVELTGNKIVIPEGGYHPLGAKGAALMYDDANLQQATHICTAVGTATTLAGIMQKATAQQQVIAVPVLKGMQDIDVRFRFLNGQSSYANFSIWNDYHFSGYAKKTAGLLSFMNDMYKKYGLPTDFVYTSKLMYAVLDKIKNDYFPMGSNIVCLHTGGLQGNRSLPAGSLIF